MKSITLLSKDIKEIIAKQFGEKIFKDGFIYNKTFSEYRRQSGDYIYIFNIELVAWTNSFSIDVKLYVSQKRIESILEKIIGKQRHKLTLGNEIGRIYKSSDGREVENGNLSIWLRQDEDIEAAIESLEWYYNDIAKLYFEKYRTLEAIDNIINNPPFTHCPAHVGGMFYERCMKGLIAARLVHNPNYEKLVEIYDEEIKGTMNQEFIDAYYKVRDYLMYNQIS